MDETDSLTDKDLSLGCYVVLKQEVRFPDPSRAFWLDSSFHQTIYETGTDNFVIAQTGMVYGHATYADDEMRVWVPIPSGIALATHLGIPILLPKYIWQVLILPHALNIFLPAFMHAPLSASADVRPSYHFSHHAPFDCKIAMSLTRLSALHHL